MLTLVDLLCASCASFVQHGFAMRLVSVPVLQYCCKSWLQFSHAHSCRFVVCLMCLISAARDCDALSQRARPSVLLQPLTSALPCWLLSICCVPHLCSTSLRMRLASMPVRQYCCNSWLQLSHARSCRFVVCLISHLCSTSLRCDWWPSPGIRCIADWLWTHNCWRASITCWR